MAQTVDLSGLVADLHDERDYIERLIAELLEADWDLATPAEGWSLKDQIWHLAYFDDAAARAFSEPDAFRAHAAAADAEVDRYPASSTSSPAIRSIAPPRNSSRSGQDSISGSGSARASASTLTLILLSNGGLFGKC